MQPPSSSRGAVEASDAVHLRSLDGATALVGRHGAQVLSWIPAGEGEQLFLSERSPLDGSAAVRGGVPVIFPQFAEYGPLRKHGFARDCEWRRDVDGPVDDASATFRLDDDAATRALWPHAFACRLTVTVGGPRLVIVLEVANRGTAPFGFSVALHTYLRVDDIDRVRVEGLQGTRYRDRTDHDRTAIEAAPTLAIGHEIDRLYLEAPTRVALVEPGRRVTVDREGFVDVVVWNPWR